MYKFASFSVSRLRRTGTPSALLARATTPSEGSLLAAKTTAKARLKKLGVAKSRKERLEDLGVTKSRRGMKGYGPSFRNPGSV
jgi:hypothetical protein